MDYTVLVNKDNKISANNNPNLVNTDSNYKSDILLEEITYESFKKLQEKALEYGYNIDIVSGYRGYDYQKKIYNKLLQEKGLNYTFRSIAKPGYSEHETGLAIDICIYRGNKCYIEHDIINMEETNWLHQVMHNYGFILRYPLDKEDITGYNYEPWHIRYVGNIASYIYNNNLTLEEYKNS